MKLTDAQIDRELDRIRAAIDRKEALIHHKQKCINAAYRDLDVRGEPRYAASIFIGNARRHIDRLTNEIRNLWLDYEYLETQWTEPEDLLIHG